MFNLADYETVAMLNKWFQDNYPMGRQNIEITYHDVEKGFITCKAEIWRDANDPYPAVTNIAHGSRDLYNTNMRRFYAEDIASSSLGRAITLLKGGQTATRDDMEKVDPNKPFEKRLQEKITVPDVSDDLWTTKMASLEFCVLAHQRLVSNGLHGIAHIRRMSIKWVKKSHANQIVYG